MSPRFYTSEPPGLTYQDIEAFERRNFIGLTNWETKLLRRVDLTVRGALVKTKEKARKQLTQKGKQNTIPIDNTDAIKAAWSRPKQQKHKKH